jgi:hypothetical protein
MAPQVLEHHADLEHHAELNSDSSNPFHTRGDDTTRAALEEEADSLAVGLLAISGYDPRYAASALQNAYGKTALEGHAGGYPELSRRQRLVQEMIEQSKWRPPGTVDRREFVKVQRLLATH